MELLLYQSFCGSGNQKVINICLAIRNRLNYRGRWRLLLKDWLIVLIRGLLLWPHRKVVDQLQIIKQSKLIYLNSTRWQQQTLLDVTDIGTVFRIQRRFFLKLRINLKHFYYINNWYKIKICKNTHKTSSRSKTVVSTYFN